MKDSNQVTDIAIVGAGPAGLSLARLLSGAGLSTVLLDRLPLGQLAEPEFDSREIALTHLSKTLLSGMGVWQNFEEREVHPLREAQVHDGGLPYALHFARTDKSAAPLGYLVANQVIRRELYRAANSCSDVELLDGCELESVESDRHHAYVTFKNHRGQRQRIGAKLLVAADSRFSPTRRMMGIGASMRDYGRVMTVANVRCELDHQNTAHECFYYGHTCAILPLNENTASVVITLPAAGAGELENLSDEAFCRRAETLLEHRLGKLSLISERRAYPLVGAFADKFVGHRFALVGDAAVGMHPVTAHGFNLGLRSADTLANAVLRASAANRDIASTRVLQEYQWRHRLLARPLYDATNAIVQLFTDDRKAALLARQAALRIGNHLPGFKNLVAHRLTQTRRFGQ